MKSPRARSPRHACKHGTGEQRAITESTCEVIGGSVSLQEMALWIARLDLDVVVHEPPELAEQLTVVAARLTRAKASHQVP